MVIAVRVVGLEHAQTVFNGDPRGDDEEPPGELVAVWPAHRVDCLPGNYHGHDSRLACAGGQLQGQPHQSGICVVVGIGQVLQEFRTDLAHSWRHFGEPDNRLHRLDLAKEGPDAGEAMAPPVLEEAGRFWFYPPVIWIGNVTPLIHVVTQLVDDRGWVVLLSLRRKPLAFVEDQFFLLVGLSPPFLGLRDGCDEFGGTTFVDDLLGRLAPCVKLPVLSRLLIRRIEDRLLEEPIFHSQSLPDVIDLPLVPVCFK